VTAPPPRTSSAGRWIGIGLFGIAAVAGAFALGKRSGESAAIAPSGAAPYVTATPSAVATSPAEPAPSVAVADDDVSPSATDIAPVATAASRAATAKVEPARTPVSTGSPASGTKSESKALTKP